MDDLTKDGLTISPLDIDSEEMNYILIGYERERKQYPTLVISVSDSKESKTSACSNVYNFCSHIHTKGLLSKCTSEIMRHVRRNIQVDVSPSNVLGEINRALQFLQDMDERIKSEFRSSISNMQHTEMLLWIVSLLIDYHEESECNKFLTLALQLYLKAYKDFDYLSDIDGITIISALSNYLAAFSRIDWDWFNLVRQFRKKFLRPWNGAEEINELNPNILDRDLIKILDASVRLGVNLFLVMNENSSLRMYLQDSVFMDFNRYLNLVKYGHEDKYYDEAIERYKSVINSDQLYNDHGPVDDNAGGRRLNEDLSNHLNPNVNARLMFRCLQILFLHFVAVSEEVLLFDANPPANTIKLTLCLETLRVIWETTPEPFVTETQFFSCFKSVQYFMHVAFVHYKLIVIDRQRYLPDIPLPLMHYARCAVRRKLASSLLLPHGGDILAEAADKVQSYVKLEVSFLDDFNTTVFMRKLRAESIERHQRMMT